MSVKEGKLYASKDSEGIGRVDYYPFNCPCGDYDRPGHTIGAWCEEGKRKHEARAKQLGISDINPVLLPNRED